MRLKWQNSSLTGL